MRKFLLVSAALLVMGTIAVAQAYDQNQDTTSPSTTNSMQQNDSTKNQQTSSATDFTDQTSQIGVNSNNYQPDYRGTELEKAYQQEEQSGWTDPDVIKSETQNQSDGG